MSYILDVKNSQDGSLAVIVGLRKTTTLLPIYYQDSYRIQTKCITGSDHLVGS